ncbi:hypothetical protein Gorai_017178 [Gossypium raimondii]|uniref:Uncharacterized protein n=1 Tax=Gossypium raimondii TaxID=29730 RepID=A0A7J8PBA9_GOSRA|nr:hypothetical protein [Gossypium raimondii]
MMLDWDPPPTLFLFDKEEADKRIAASVGAVEALKDQGFWRWNHGIRALNQSAKNNVRSYSQANKLSSSSIVQSKTRDEKVKAGWGIFEKSDVLGLFGSLLTLMVVLFWTHMYI